MVLMNRLSVDQLNGRAAIGDGEIFGPSARAKPL